MKKTRTRLNTHPIVFDAVEVALLVACVCTYRIYCVFAEGDEWTDKCYNYACANEIVK